MWERDVAAQIGLGVAVEHALGWGIDAIAERNTALAAGLRSRLAELPGVTVRDRGVQLCAITTFTVEGMDPEEVRTRLRAERVNVSVSTLDSAHLDLSHRGLESVVRASVHYVTTEEELDRFASVLRDVITS
jgi:selenocysteine lyase/cysteine desulfurase